MAETKEKKSGIQHFDGTVNKINAAGMLVASSYVDYDIGEKLTTEVDSEEISEASVTTGEVVAEQAEAAAPAAETKSEPAKTETTKATAEDTKSEPAKTDTK